MPKTPPPRPIKKAKNGRRSRQQSRSSSSNSHQRDEVRASISRGVNASDAPALKRGHGRGRGKIMESANAPLVAPAVPSHFSGITKPKEGLKISIPAEGIVWLYTDRSNPSLHQKLQSFWSGPYRVIKQISNTIFKIESYGRWSKEKIVTSAAVDRLKKCYVADPETNLDVPVELTAADVRPYFDNKELLGRLPASDFAQNVSDKKQELPLTLFSDQPRDDLRAKPVVMEEARSTPEVPTSLRAEMPAEVPTAVTMHAEPPAQLASPEVAAPEPEPSEPVVAKRKRGQPPGSKNKPRVCPNCTAYASCISHCNNGKEGLACNLHTAAQRCAKCTRTRLCAEHA